MTFCRAGAFVHVPVPDGTTWWSARISARSAPDPTAVTLDDVAALYRTEARPREICRAPGELHGVTLHHVLGRVPVRHDDRTVLIGDAAHPVGAGRGASMATEDAVVLAREVHRAGAVAPALAAYDRVREGRLRRMAEVASANRDAKTAGPPAGRLRDLLMPILFPRLHARATGWLYDHELGTLPTTVDGLDDTSGGPRRRP
ncbi:FAD-dependent monooxygenase [Streptomyces sp. SID3343]|uniref:FAD-dependent monooxygenase n=1 Tax=Streptomyces sp. SID3343 TaxID=2690260 RepID=UPI00136985D8|nr:FAD-dependent monooxygenase [Streptomyces sp. SID3343]MYV99730.1 hypothetical protein [Streptomyces sp. SID3343]